LGITINFLDSITLSLFSIRVSKILSMGNAEGKRMRKCEYSAYCKLYKSSSFNCNNEPEGCGNWRFINTHESLTSYQKQVYIPFFVKFEQHLLYIILILCLRLLTKNKQNKTFCNTHESLTNSGESAHLSFSKKIKKSILSTVSKFCLRFSTTHGYDRRYNMEKR
jgi:hypothetical protein